MTYDCISHAQRGLLIVELEAAEAADANRALMSMRELQQAVFAMRGSQEGLEQLATTVARDLRLLTGYERVVVYRFDGEWNGEAIAEDKVQDW